MKHPASRTGYLAWQVGQIMAARVERALRPFELTLAQHSALLQAVLAPGISSAEAARRAAITPQSMGSAVNGLVARRLLERRAAAEDRRAHRLYVTDSGRHLVEEAQAAVDAVHDEALQALSPQQQAEAHELLTTLLRTLNPAAL